MLKLTKMWIPTVCLAAVVALPAPVFAGVQTKALVRVSPDVPDAGVVESDSGFTQEQLLKLLRVTPTLADVVANDPSLLADGDYVAKTNPELAAFLQQHPEVTRNPGFYLFSDLRKPGRRGYEVMTPKTGFEPQYHDTRSPGEAIMNDVAPVIVAIAFFGSLVWLIRLILQNKRWKQMFALHGEVHTRLLDKMATSQEMLAYMDTEAGRRFLEAAPIATELENKRVPNVVSRILVTLQAGIVLSALGFGLLVLRNSVGDQGTTVVVLGTLVAMPGIGCIVSAGLTWIVAQRLGLMPSTERGEERVQR